jgi:hypothetical protein
VAERAWTTERENGPCQTLTAAEKNGPLLVEPIVPGPPSDLNAKPAGLGPRLMMAAERRQTRTSNLI